MIHISKTQKGNFIVVNVAKNGEPLNSSEPLESKQSCWENIQSALEGCYATYIGQERPVAVVQDNTLKKIKVWIVGDKRTAANGIKPQTPHVPK